jgi:hypothetical protein
VDDPPMRAFAKAVAPRPRLWWVGLRTAVRLAEPGWWRRWPPVPVPPAHYWTFRLETAYGGQIDRRGPSTDDIASYLEWCRTRPRGAR